MSTPIVFVSKDGQEFTIEQVLAMLPNPAPITFADTPFIDGFHRLKVSTPVNEFTSEFQYNLHPLYYDAVTAVNATITHNAPFSAGDLNVSTDNGSRALLQTLEYLRYQPGKALAFGNTFIMPTRQAGTFVEVGYGDDENGFLLQVKDTNVVQFVRRSKASGSVVDHSVLQQDWNHDTLDGSGGTRNPSGIRLDFTKSQQLRVDLQWLSNGRIRMMFDVDGALIQAHDFHIANELAEPATTTANLPVRWLIENTAAVSSTKTLIAICATVYNEGGDQTELGHPFTGGNGATTRSVTAAANTVPICSIRPAQTLNSITFRGKIRIESFEIITDQDLFYQIIYKPTSITGSSWVSPVTHSAVETEISGSAIVGGVAIQGGYVSAGAKKDVGSGRVPFTSKLPIALDSAGTDQSRSISLVVTRITADALCAAQFNWTEVR